MGEAPRGGQLITWSSALIILLGITARTLKKRGEMPGQQCWQETQDCSLTEGHLVFNTDILPDDQPEKPVATRNLSGKIPESGLIVPLWSTRKIDHNQKSIGRISRKWLYYASHYFYCLVYWVIAFNAIDETRA
jgi:hypothetical protein